MGQDFLDTWYVPIDIGEVLQRDLSLQVGLAWRRLY